MESTTSDVQQDVQQFSVVDGGGLPPAPTSIKEQMPLLAEFLRDLASKYSRDAVGRMVQASVDLRKAYDRDDYQGVREVYQRGCGWIDGIEGGYCLGVPAEAMRTFAQRHRGGHHGAH